jgi:TRAP-type C4-dicarboxylate transport system substrate-binding protein
MSRRRFLKAAALCGAAALAGQSATLATGAQPQPSTGAGRRRIRILMGGYGPASTGFSLALQQIGDRLQRSFGDRVEVKYVYNILDLGYRVEDILWLVERGVLTLGYLSSSYLTDRVHDLEAVDLPFLFADTLQARRSMDGRLGRLLTARIEASTNYRVLGYFENGFRHVSNRVRPVHVAADMNGLTIRVLPSQVQARTFELLGAKPMMMDLTEAIDAIKAGTLDAQENPFANTVTYGIHRYHHFHSATNHFYSVRPILVHRPTFQAWPRPLQEALREAAHDAIEVQRQRHVKEEADAMIAIRAEGGEILELTQTEHQTFAAAVTPIYTQAHRQYSREVLALLNLSRT